MKDQLQNVRSDYQKHSLDINRTDENPFKQFESWLEDYKTLHPDDFNCMVLSTVDKNCRPSSRIVLLKGFNDSGLDFYTNYDSKKGRDMEANPIVALNFFWPERERQIRIEGKVVKLSSEESTEYYQSRPRLSQLGAWASDQSKVIESREVLEDKMKKLEEQYGDEIPRPENWGGYRVIPDYFEFWQGRASRLHDRITYKLSGSSWERSRLSP